MCPTATTQNYNTVSKINMHESKCIVNIQHLNNGITLSHKQPYSGTSAGS
jgi:hypothetical protein